MPEGEQEHGCVPMAVAVIAGCLDEPLDLLFGQMLARIRVLLGKRRRTVRFTGVAGLIGEEHALASGAVTNERKCLA